MTGIAGHARARTAEGCVVDGVVRGTRLHVLVASIDESLRRGTFGTDDCAETGEVVDLDSVALLAPLVPSVIWCAAANYTDHVAEMSGRTLAPKEHSTPYFFLKPGRHTVLGPDDPVVYPADSRALDWEAEIGVIIGRSAYRVDAHDAMAYVAGYVIVNDLSARDLTRRSDPDGAHFGADWFRCKTFDGAAPIGPWITPRDAIADPHSLAIKLWVNDKIQQDSSSRYMWWTIPEQIAYLSRQVTLQPGDVIATGTPAGCGRPRGIYLEPGDRIRIEIEGLGVLCNEVKKP